MRPLLLTVINGNSRFQENPYCTTLNCLFATARQVRNTINSLVLLGIFCLNPGIARTQPDASANNFDFDPVEAVQLTAANFTSGPGIYLPTYYGPAEPEHLNASSPGSFIVKRAMSASNLAAGVNYTDLGGRVTNNYQAWDPSVNGWVPGNYSMVAEGEVVAFSVEVSFGAADVNQFFEFTVSFDYDRSNSFPPAGGVGPYAYIDLDNFNTTFTPTLRGGAINSTVSGASIDGNGMILNVFPLAQGVGADGAAAVTGDDQLAYEIELQAPSTPGNYYIYFGAKTAKPGSVTEYGDVVGMGEGLAAWPVGTFQSKLVQVTGNKTVNAQPGDIETDLMIYKLVDTNSDGAVDLTGGVDNDPLLAGYTIQLCASGSPPGDPSCETLVTDNTGQIIFTAVEGSYSIYETSVPGGYEFVTWGGDVTNIGGVNNEGAISIDPSSETGNIGTVTNRLTAVPQYSIVKTITNPGTITAAGNMVNYSILVTNDGNVPVTGVSVSDPLLEGPNGTLNGPVESMTADGILEIGETWSYTGSYTVQQSDIDNNGGGDGNIDNTATVSSNELDDESDDASQPISRNLQYSIVKTITNPGDITAAGDMINYSITVSNDGNVTLTGVSVADPLLQAPNGTLSGPVESISSNGLLDVGEDWTYSGSYTVQQADIDNNGGGDGDIDNTATVSSNELPDEDDSAAQPIDYNPQYSILKTITNPGDIMAASELINYSIVVSNDGNVTLTGVSVADPLLEGANGTLNGPVESMTSDGILEVGETWTYTGSYTVQQTDIDDNGGGDGDIDNTATVSSNELPDENDSASQPIDQDLQYSIIKTITNPGTITAAGQMINYSIEVTNDGNVSLNGVSLSDPLLEGPNGTLNGPVESMAADGILETGETWSYTGSYTVQQSDIDDNGGGDGDIDNTATVTSNELPDEDDSAAQPINRNPQYSIVKTITNPGNITAAGDMINYSIIVSNDGNVSLTGVNVSDPLLQGANGSLSAPNESLNADGILEVGETWSYTGSYTVQQADIDNNGGGDSDVDNTATLSSDELPDEEDSAAQPIVRSPSYSIEKTITNPGNITTAGDVIDYQIVVTNTGNTSLTGVSVTDPLLQGANGTLSTPTESITTDNILEVGETWSYTGSYTVQQADIDNNGGGDGDVDNTATVSSNELASKNDSAAQPILRSPAYTIEKSITNPGNITAAGDMINYSIVVTNDGNTSLTNVLVADPRLQGANGTLNGPVESMASDGILEVGENWSYTGSYTVQQSDIDNNGGGDGDIDNTATVSSNELPNESDSASQPINRNPQYSIVKTITNPGTITGAGEMINYSIVVTNDGNVTLTGVMVTDPLLQGANGSLGAPVESLTANGLLEVGENWNYTGSYTVQQGDIDNNGGGDGDIDNTATVSSNQLADKEDSAAQPIDGNPSYNIVKTITNPGTVTAAGQMINYQIVVTNLGNTSLTGVNVSDPLLQGANGNLSGPTESGTTNGILDVGENWTYTGSYTVQQGDIDNNGGGDSDIDNTATVSSNELPDDSDSAAQPIDRNPQYSITKTITNPGDITAAGDMINYQIVVSNDGNTTLTNVSVADPLLEGANGTLSTPVESINTNGILEVGENWTYTGSYTVQQTDIDNNGGGDGDIDNTATVSSDELPDEEDSAAQPIDRDPQYSIVKTITNPGNITAAGDMISYSIVVTNDGNVSLTGVSVGDPLLQGANGSLSAPVESITADDILEVGETWSYTGSYTVQQSDIDNNGGGDGDIDNTATVSSDELPDETDSAAQPIDRDPQYSIVKTITNPGDITAAGEIINYSIVVTNDGNVSLTSVSVADPLLQGANGSLSAPAESLTADGILEVGETWSYTGSYTVQQTDIDNNGGGDSDIDNTATVSSDQLPSEQDSAAQPIAQDIQYSIEKTITNPGNITAAGQMINYQIVVSNDGNVSLTGVEVSDPLLEGANGSLSGPTESISANGILNVNETWTYTGSYTVQQSDIDNDGGGDSDIDNTATVSSNELPDEEDSAAQPIAQDIDYSIEKTITNPGNITAAGNVINYQIVVTNDGNVTLTGVSVADPLLEGANGNLSGPVESVSNNGNLDVNETWTYTGSYTVQQSDLDNNGGGDGDVDNTATVSSNELPDDDDSAAQPISRSPSYSIVKTITNPGTINAAGDVINYQIVVSNTGNISLTGVSLADPLLEGSNGTLSAPVESMNADGILEVGENWTYTGSYTAQQADIDNNGGGDGDIDNTATVSSNELPSEEDSAAQPIFGNPSYAIVKTITNPGSVSSAGDVINYQIVVTNSGNTSLTGVDVSDPLLEGPNGTLSAPAESLNADGTLEVGENWTYTGSYTVQQADIDNNGGGDGDIDNTATVSSNELPDDEDSAAQPISRSPSYEIEKTITNPGNITGAGDVINYEIVVTNDGNVTLTGVVVTDPLLEGANGTFSGPTESVSANGLLDVNETWTYTGTYTVQQSDINNNGGGDGDIDNTATVSSDELPDKEDSAAQPIAQDIDYSIEKTITNPGDITSAGQVINYQIVVTNDGNVTLTGVDVSDPLLDGPNGSLSAPVESVNANGLLDVNETWTYTGSYTVQQSDIDNNGGGDSDIDNTATVSSNELPDEEDSAAQPIEQDPQYSIEKTITNPGNITAAGDVINYQIVVTNDGNTTLTGVAVSDPLLEGPNGSLSGPFESVNTNGLLEVGETWTYAGSYTVQQSNIDNNGGGDGDIDNTATVTSNELPAEEDSAAQPIAQDQGYSIEKTITNPGDITAAGQVIHYQIVVTNDGNVTLTGVNVSDPLLEGPNGSLSGPIESVNTNGLLQVSETWTYTGSYTVQQSDLDNNGGGDSDIDNTATVSSNELPDEEDSAAQPIDRDPQYSIEKTITNPGNITTAGDVINYQIVVSNDGNVTLTGVAVSDPLLEGLYGTLSGPAESVNTNGILEVNETWTYTGSYIVQQSDLDNNGGGDGDVDNTATVSSNELPDEEDSATQPIAQDFGYSIEKTITNPGIITAAGQVVNYEIVVNNTGNVTLTGVAVSDPLLEGANGSLSGPAESISINGLLDVNETWTYSGSYTVQQSDLDNNGGGDGDIDNTATVSSNELPDEEDSAAQPVSRNPSYSINKTITNPGDITAAGDEINYQIVVTNSGNISLTGVSLADPLLEGPDGTLNGPVESLNADGILEVGETWTYTGSYTAQQADIDNNGGGDGDIDNTATVSSNELPDEGDKAAQPIFGNPSYSIVKTITNPGSISAAGEVINYQIVVNNTGNTSLTGVSVSDPLLEGAGGTLSAPAESLSANGVLDVDETWTYTGSYTVQQADIDNNGGGDGDIDNIATVTSNELPDEEDGAVQPIMRSPSYDIVKTITNPVAITAAGDVVQYQIVVTNSGNVTLTGVAVSDPLLEGANGSLSGPIESVTANGILDVDETWTYTGSYTVQQADIDDNGDGDGDIDNTATVSSDELPDEEDSASQPIEQDIQYSIEKTITNPGAITAAGQVINYQIVVSNDGNVTLTGVDVSDPLLEGVNGNLSGPAESISANGLLDVNETWTYTGSYTVQQADIDNNGGGDGDIDNTATAGSNELPDESDSAQQPVEQAPSLSVEKTQTDGPSPVTAAGQTITYTILVTNTGNTSLTNVAPAEDFPGAGMGTLSGETESLTDDDILEVGESWEYTATYTVTQADVDAGATLVNRIIVDTDQTEPEEDTEETPVDGIEAIQIIKSNNGSDGFVDNDLSGDLSVGDELTYTYTVENTGTVTLTGVTVMDDLLGPATLSDNGGDGTATLAPGAVETGTLTYLIQAGDLGTTITNIATGDSDQTDPETDTNDVPVPTPSMSIVKANNSTTDFADNDENGYISLGDEITYTYTVTNTGTANLTNVSVVDDLLGPVTLSDLAGNGVGFLAPGDVETGTLSYVVQTKDVGTSIINVATGDSDQTDPVTDTNEVPVVNFVCPGYVNLTLNSDCTATLDIEDLGFPENGGLPEGKVTIIIEDLEGNLISTDGTIPGPGTYRFIIQITGEENSQCWGYVTAEDNTLPTLICPDEVYETNKEPLLCVDVAGILIEGIQSYEVDNDGNVTDISDDLKAILDHTGYPTVMDNCQGLTVYVTDELQQSEMCDYQSIIRTFWIEAAIKGKPETLSCTQEIHFAKPTLDDVEGPDDAKFSCTDEFEVDANGNPHPDESGYPVVVTGTGNYELAPDFCNLGASYTDGQRIMVCEGTYKFIRHWDVIDWCAPEGERLARFDQIIKVGDTDGPAISCVEVDYDHDGHADLRTYSTGPYDCSAAFEVPMPEISDDCSSWSLLTEIISGGQVVATIPSGANRYVSGIPAGCHLIRYTVTDDCGNTTVQECPFQVLDKIEPIAVCNEDLNISLGGENFGRVAANRVDEGSSDNCGPVYIEVRRRILNIEEYDCLEMFDYNNNGEIIGDEVTLSEEFGDPDGDGPGDKFYYTPWEAFADFTCCDLDDMVRIEMRVWDDANGSGVYGDELETPDCYGYESHAFRDNYNVCWLDVLIEDKIPPVCTPPPGVIVDCDELPFDFDPQNEVQMTGLFGAATGYDNCRDWTVEELDAILDLDDCGSGSFTRQFRVTDAKGNKSPVCKQLVTIHQVNDYWIKFPADSQSSCGTVDADTIAVSEGACDLLAISVRDEVFPASGNECYKIFRTYSVINWCEYDGISPPVVVGRDVDCDSKPGDEDIYVIVKTIGEPDPCHDNYNDNPPNQYEHVWYDRDSDPFNLWPEKGTKGTACDYTTNPFGFWKESYPVTENEDIDSDGYPANGSQNCNIASVGYWQYMQIIKVHDTVDPVIHFTEPEPFCSYSSDLDNDCPAEVNIEFRIEENCTPKDLTITVFLDANNDGTMDGDISGQLSGAYPNYTVSGQFPLGQHSLGIHVSDGCDNSTGATIPFEVEDCKAPTPICINGLAVELMPVIPALDVDGDGIVDDGAMTVWVSDFIASPVSDCSGEVTYSINRLGEGNNPDNTSLTLTCNDDANVVVEIWAYDQIGNADFCITYVLVQDNMVQCTTGDGAIAGIISTEEDIAVEGVMVELSGGQLQAMETDLNGHYAFDNLQTGFDYTVTPQQNVNHLNGVSTFDLVLMSKHVLGTAPLDSPYKRIAADVNNDKRITAMDAIALRQLILNIHLKFANNTSWRFIPAKYVFPDPKNPWSKPFPEVINVNNLQKVLDDEDFIAIKIGDINLSAKPNLLVAEERDLKGLFLLNVEDQDLQAGNEYRVDFRADEINKIQGYQFTLALDPNVVELTDMTYGIAQANHFGMRYLDDGLIATSWNRSGDGTHGFREEEVLFSLIIRAKTDASLSEVLGVSSRVTAAEAYDQNDGLLDVGIDFQSGTVSTAPFELYQNVPNPFREQTTIGFFLPEAGEATISVHDVSGRIIKLIRAEFGRGENQVILKRDELPDTGMLYYTLTAGEHTATRKMILVK